MPLRQPPRCDNVSRGVTPARADNEDMARRRLAWWSVPLIVAVLLTASPAKAQDTREQELSSALMSPFCPGLLLVNCPSPNARTLRVEIAGRFARGESRGQIEDDLIDRYGASILGSPRPVGLGLLAWLLPGMTGLLTLSLAGIAVRRAVSRGETSQPAHRQAPLDPRAATRLEEELERLD